MARDTTYRTCLSLTGSMGRLAEGSWAVEG